MSPTHIIFVVCIVSSMLWCSDARAQAASEYSIKAGYLLLFTRYVQWPAQAFANEGEPINICILGDDPFGAVLDRTVAGQRSQNRPLRVHRLESTENADRCHVAFISARESDNEAQWLSDLAGRPILTIGENTTALDSGCVLTFVSEQDRGQSRIRFDASFPAMRAASLKISSQMLVAARKVHRIPGA